MNYLHHSNVPVICFTATLSDYWQKALCIVFKQGLKEGVRIFKTVHALTTGDSGDHEVTGEVVKD